MCGVIGWSRSADGGAIDRHKLDMALHDLESRGQDATGVAGWNETEGRIVYCKAAVRARDFGINSRVIGRVGIGHTRAATQGSPSNIDNNHPILCGNIIGVHNGMLWNDREFNALHDLGAKYEVDSEVLFRAIEKADGDLDLAAKMMRDIEGDATIMWLDSREFNTLYVAAMGGRPAIWCQTVDGSFVVASTEEACAEAIGWNTELVDHGHIPDGELWVVREGEVILKREWAEISWSSYAFDRVDRSKANGPGAKSTVYAMPGGRKFTVTRQRPKAQLPKYNGFTYAQATECYSALEILENDYMVSDIHDTTVWFHVKQNAMPLEGASVHDDPFAYEYDDRGNRTYFVNTVRDGFLPVTKRTVQDAAQRMFEWAEDARENRERMLGLTSGILDDINEGSNA